MKVHAVILAGGAGERLGRVHKALLRIGNQRLVDRVAGRLQGTETLLVATGPNECGRILEAGTNVADAAPVHDGPMAGLSAAINHLRNVGAAEDVLISVAVDTPFLPHDYLERMVAALQDGAPAAYATWGDEFYPTNAAWELSAVPAKLPNSPRALHAQLGSRAVDWSDQLSDNPFSNLNTLGDLIALSRRHQAVE